MRDLVKSPSWERNPNQRREYEQVQLEGQLGQHSSLIDLRVTNLLPVLAA